MVKYPHGPVSRRPPGKNRERWNKVNRRERGGEKEGGDGYSRATALTHRDLENIKILKNF
jgi:hypothetical protein